MREIPLSRGKVALVDDEDYERVSKFTWTANPGRPKRHAPELNWRAARWTGPKAGPRHVIYLHQEILGPVPPGSVIDHINGNGLDNRRANLRICSSKENVRSMHARRGRSGFKGVFEKHPKNCVLKKPFLAQIVVDQKQINLGYYATADEAARVYDAAAKKYFGEFAQLNFPEPQHV